MNGNHSRAHTQLVNAILLRYGQDPRVKVAKNHVGFDEARRVRYGIKGSPDILGIVGPHGRALGIEVKTGVGRLSPQQKAWRRVFEAKGGLYVEARSVEDVERVLS